MFFNIHFPPGFVSILIRCDFVIPLPVYLNTIQ